MFRVGGANVKHRLLAVKRQIIVGALLDLATFVHPRDLGRGIARDPEAQACLRALGGRDVIEARQELGRALLLTLLEIWDS